MVLLHGLGSRGDDLRQVAAAVDGASAVLMPDLRGHGDQAPAPFTALRDFASDVEPLTRDGQPVIIAGFSFGAWVALELWRLAPAAISAVVLVDPPLDHGALYEWARGQSRSARGAMRKLGQLFRTRDLGRALALMAEHPLTRDLGADDRLANAQALLAADRATLSDALRLRAPDAQQARPPGSNAALRVLHGSRSLVCPGPAARQLALQIGGRSIEYDGGHCAHFEAPDAVGRALSGLLNGP